MNANESMTLACSLGQGGYDVAFADAVESQRQYCDKHGYRYICVSEPGSPLLGRENIWLKPFLLYGALLKNDFVLYLDTDVKIQPGCPAIDQAVSDQNPIGVVAGHSGRVNAGVILARRNPQVLSFFAEWVASLGRPIAARHDVGWGENGHLIRLVEKYGIQPIDTRWNNTFNPELDDYIRHYTGPLRREYSFEGQSEDAWTQILKDLENSKEMDPVDIITSFAELKKVYQRSAPEELFASFEECWEAIRELVVPSDSPLGTDDTWGDRHVYVAEEIADSSPNAYVVTLKDGLERALQATHVTTGVTPFWDHSFRQGDILHIEWIESLFGWKIPTQDQLTQFEFRMREISLTSPIVYTAHNFDLMPTYGESRNRLLQMMADHGTMIIHLSDANIAPYNEHHSAIQGLQDLPTAVVPHGDYQPYFRLNAEAFQDPALQTDKIKILVFGHIRTDQELNFCLDVGKELGEDRFQLIFTGAIHPDIIHWKETHHFRDEWDGGARRIHFNVPSEQIISLVSQCDGLLIPRFDRLNSGVQFLAFSLLKPAFVPAQNAMEEVQKRAVGQGIYTPNDAKSAAEVIRQNYEGSIVAKMKLQFDTNAFNYMEQDVWAVGLAHKIAYERAAEYYDRRKAVRAE
jgi:hypothetical protein